MLSLKLYMVAYVILGLLVIARLVAGLVRIIISRNGDEQD